MSVTREERRLIDEAVAAGLVTHVPARAVVRAEAEPVAANVSCAPRKAACRPRRVPEALSVRAALEWAFADECAQMDVDEIGASSGGQARGRSVEAVIAERAALGPVRIDTSPGRSLPADEADVIASVLRATLSWRDACWVADLARARRAPDCLMDPQPKLRPVGWVYGRGCVRGRTADVMQPGVGEAVGRGARGGWPRGTGTRRNRKGVVVSDPVLVVPCEWSPTAQQIGEARRVWLAWWGHLLDVRCALGRRVGRIEITPDMPPKAPWRHGC